MSVPGVDASPGGRSNAFQRLRACHSMTRADVVAALHLAVCDVWDDRGVVPWSGVPIGRHSSRWTDKRTFHARARFVGLGAAAPLSARQLTTRSWAVSDTMFLGHRQAVSVERDNPDLPANNTAAGNGCRWRQCFYDLAHPTSCLPWPRGAIGLRTNWAASRCPRRAWRFRVPRRNEQEEACVKLKEHNEKCFRVEGFQDFQENTGA